MKKRLSYNQETGKVTWTNDSDNQQHKHFKEAGTISGTGYRNVMLLGTLYRVHRVIWLYMTGSWPEYSIDHINGDILDNSFNNLRDVTRQENSRNSKLSVRSTTGVCGVTWHKTNLKWNAAIGVGYRQVYLGCSESFLEACCMRKSAELKYNFHENHGRVILN